MSAIRKPVCPSRRCRRWCAGGNPLAASCCAVAVCLAICCSSVLAAEAAKKSPTWLVGKRFDDELQGKLSATWSNIPLGEALASLSASTRVATLVDRRIDPGQPLSVTAANQPLEEILRQIAEAEQLGISLWEPIVYFGPPQAAAALRTLAWLRHQDVERLPPARRQALLAARAWEWNDLATPRGLLARLAAEAHVRLEGIEQVPHDLWAARRLPPMAWIDRLTVVAIQFGLTFEVAADGQSVRLVAMPAKVTARRSFAALGEVREQISLLAERHPETVVRVEGDEIVADGRIEDLERLARSVAGRAERKKPAAGKQLYTLSVEMALGKLLEQLAGRLDVEFQLDRPAIERASISLDQIVSVKVEDASLDALVKAVLEPAGLKGVRKGRIVSVGPGKPTAAKP